MNTRIITILCLLVSFYTYSGHITRIKNTINKPYTIELGWDGWSDTVKIHVDPNDTRNYDNEGYCVNYIAIHSDTFKDRGGKVRAGVHGTEASTGAGMACQDFTMVLRESKSEKTPIDIDYYAGLK